MENNSINYKELYEEALGHLCTLFATRNSLSPAASEAIWDAINESFELRTEEIEKLHQEISKFIDQHIGDVLK